MELFFSPLACSLASRIAIHEAGLDAAFTQVDLKTKTLSDGDDYRPTYALGLVPALRTEDGALLTENVAVLLHLSERAGQPTTPDLVRWLSFIATELHKGTFNPVFDRHAPEEAKRYALSKAGPRLAFVDAHLRDHEHLLDAPSVADFYLYTVLNWLAPTPLELSDYPALQAFHDRMTKRPSVARAFREELPLYQALKAS